MEISRRVGVFRWRVLNVVQGITEPLEASGSIVQDNFDANSAVRLAKVNLGHAGELL